MSNRAQSVSLPRTRAYFRHRRWERGARRARLVRTGSSSRSTLARSTARFKPIPAADGPRAELVRPASTLGAQSPSDSMSYSALRMPRANAGSPLRTTGADRRAEARIARARPRRPRFAPGCSSLPLIGHATRARTSGRAHARARAGIIETPAPRRNDTLPSVAPAENGAAAREHRDGPYVRAFRRSSAQRRREGCGPHGSTRSRLRTCRSSAPRSAASIAACSASRNRGFRGGRRVLLR